MSRAAEQPQAESTHWISPAVRLPVPLRDVPVVIESEGELVEEFGYLDFRGRWRLVGLSDPVVEVLYWFDLPPIPKPQGAAMAPAQPAVAQNTGSRGPEARKAPPPGDPALLTHHKQATGQGALRAPADLSQAGVPA